MNRALSTKSLLRSFLSVACRSAISIILIILISTCLIFSQTQARIVVLDVLYAKKDPSKIVYLFGDEHFLLSEVVNSQLEQLQKVVKQQNRNSMILVEDPLAFRDEKLSSDDDGFLPGLVQRINQWGNSAYVHSQGIENRGVLTEALTVFNPFSVPPVIVSSHKPQPYNPYTKTFDDLFNEVEILYKDIQLLSKSINADDNCNKIIFKKIELLQSSCIKLLDALAKTQGTIDDVIYLHALKLYNKQIHACIIKNGSDLTWGALSDEIAHFYERMINKGSNGVTKKEAEDLNQRIMNYLNERKGGDYIVCYMNWLGYLYRIMYDALHDVLVHILDPFIFLNILKYIPQGSVVVFAGADHTKNVKEMLIEFDFVHNTERSVPYEGTDIKPFPLNKIAF